MDFTSITLNAAAKAMHDCVLPALASSGDRQALEQAHLVWDAIMFARDRVDLIDARRRTEVLELSTLMGQLMDLDSVRRLAVSDRMAQVHAESLQVLAHPASTAREYSDLGVKLGETLTSLLAEADDLAAPTRSEIERAVLDHSLRKLELDRAWLLPLGLDPDPSTVRDLQTLLKGGSAE
ncbi:MULTISPECIES: hypothetical protein [unclassified Rhodococcus (in: high G+C Gram-positive bacteria)]|uniref:hypothetical protein n=1 Tax=unclassified Rhodococcus (in: high G+C Gram-positive bacteria) TaxID=192944 RepID=UPI00163AB2DB|nr:MULTISPECIES: hypothetical protein [unclassified Rhodococcus (in: high G+C Gram-positive bacteria)]MBC2637632.1 hypothetical protein [Rhodococcus sp. 3A]MBC2897624.1 hypothetical protein [Rhodococcus sp. 4CII]